MNDPYGVTLDNVPELAAHSTLLDSQAVDESTTAKVDGTISFQKPILSPEVRAAFLTCGFQATQLAKAIEEISRMVRWRPSSYEIESLHMDPNARCHIWLSFTSNMISSGLREAFVFLAQNKLIDVVVTSAGGVEEDFIKCLSPTYLGRFDLKGASLREKGWNRIGNLIVPNKNYCQFEDWVQPLLDECLKRQVEHNINWTPSTLIDFLASQTQDESSLYYWCHRNNIPTFSPAITDGSLGDNLYFHSYRNPGLKIDVLEDLNLLYKKAVSAPKIGLIMLGGGIAMHHCCMAQMPRGGADFAVLINTGQEFDGCFSGSTVSSLKSWKYLRPDSTPIKVFCDATICFPLIIASAFQPTSQAS